MTLLHSRRARLMLALLSGLLTGLTLIFPGALGWLEWLAPAAAVPILWQLAEMDCRKKRYRLAYAAGAVFFLAFYLVTFHWFWALYPLSFAGFSPGVAALVVAIAWLGVSIFQTAGMALTFTATVFLWRLPLSRRHPVLRPLLAAAVLTVAEWIQTLGRLGVPWARLSLGQAVYLPVVQTASLFGCYGITFLLIAVSFSLGQALLTVGGRRVLCVLAGSLFAGNLILGSILYAVGEQRTPRTVLTAGAVQGNCSTVTKWNMTVWGTVKLHRSHMESLVQEGVDLILLAETAFPFYLQDYPEYQRQLSQIAEQGETAVFVGTFVYDDDGAEYSSVSAFLSDGQVDDAVYHKRRLVPFGEFVPMEGLVTTLIPPLAELNLWESELDAGEAATVLWDINGTYGFLICFDSIYEDVARDSVKNGAELLLLSTNDSWFLDSAAVRMHHNQARLRAIECGRSIVRAANTGISSLITPTGRVTEMLEPLVEGTVRGEVGLYDHTTLYVLGGNWFVVLCAAAALCPLGDKLRLCLDKKDRACYNKQNIDET